MLIRKKKNPRMKGNMETQEVKKKKLKNIGNIRGFVNI